LALGAARRGERHCQCEARHAVEGMILAFGTSYCPSAQLSRQNEQPVVADPPSGTSKHRLTRRSDLSEADGQRINLTGRRGE